MSGGPFVWSLRREAWESRSIYIAPLAVAAFALVGSMIRMLAKPNGDIRLTFEFGEGVIMFTTLVVAVFYSIDALCGERRDRSILFWKSMPVSDVTTVLAKASIPIVVLPLITFVVTVALHIGMALFASIATRNGVAVWSFLPEKWADLLFHLVTVHGIAWAPLFAWMLLVSAFARRAPLIWAVVPPLAIALVERIAFGTSSFASMLSRQLSGNDTMTGSGTMIGHPMPAEFLAWPGWWVGLLIAAGFIAAAARLRRLQVPI